MSFLQLVLKQMRQRALSTWLTMLSVVLGVAMATAVMIVHRGGGAIFGQTEFGYDILIGPPKGSPLQLVLNTVYQIDFPAGNLPYSVYEDILANRRQIKHAIPVAAGDTYKGMRIVATLPKMFGYDESGQRAAPENSFEYKTGRRYEFAQGTAFHRQKFEAVIGADIPARTGLKMGDQFKASHGGLESSEHHEQWTVVGILEKTGTAADRVIYIPLTSFFAIEEHEQGMEAQAKLRAELNGPAPATAPATAAASASAPATHAADEHDEHFEMRPDGTIDLKLPKADWQISAILVKTRGYGAFAVSDLIYHFKVIDPRAVAVNPATEMYNFFHQFFEGTQWLLLGIAVLVSVVASVGILVSIYNSVSARMREIAILRALGATRGKVLGLICAEAGLIGLGGGILGLIAGHALGGAGSVLMQRLIGEGFNWINIGWGEWIYLLVVVALSVLAGLVPALKAYRTPVADNLVAG